MSDYEDLLIMYGAAPKADPWQTSADGRQAAYFKHSPEYLGWADAKAEQFQREQDAKIKDPLTERQLLKDPTYQALAERLYNVFGSDQRLAANNRNRIGQVAASMSKGLSTAEDKAEWLTMHMAGFLNSLPMMLWDYSRLKDMPYNVVKDFNDALNMYDSTDLNARQIARATALAIPEILFGGLGFTLSKAATRGMTKGFVKTKLADILRQASKPLRNARNQAMLEGAIYAGGLEAGREGVSSTAEQRPYDVSVPAAYAVAGGAMGGGGAALIQRAPQIVGAARSFVNKASNGGGGM